MNNFKTQLKAMRVSSSAEEIRHPSINEIAICEVLFRALYNP
jgi:hypothetical protein